MQKKKKVAENFYFKSAAFGNPDQKKKLLLPEMGVTRKVFTREAANLFFNQFPGDILFPSLVSSHFFVFLGFFVCLCLFFPCVFCILVFLFVCVCFFLAFFVCLCLFVPLLFLYSCFFMLVCVCFLKLRKYVLIHIRLCASVNDKKIFTWPIFGNKTTFFGPS